MSPSILCCFVTDASFAVQTVDSVLAGESLQRANRQVETTEANSSQGDSGSRFSPTICFKIIRANRAYMHLDFGWFQKSHLSCHAKNTCSQLTYRSCVQRKRASRQEQQKQMSKSCFCWLNPPMPGPKPRSAKGKWEGAKNEQCNLRPK